MQSCVSGVRNLAYLKDTNYLVDKDNSRISTLLHVMPPFLRKLMFSLRVLCLCLSSAPSWWAARCPTLCPSQASHCSRIGLHLMAQPASSCSSRSLARSATAPTLVAPALIFHRHVSLRFTADISLLLKAIAADSSSNLYIVGSTTSTDFPVVAVAGSSLNGQLDGFVLKFLTTSSTIALSRYVGGSANDSLSVLYPSLTFTLFYHQQ